MTPELKRQIEQREEVLAKVRRMLIDKLHVERTPEELDPDTPIFGSGLGLDSIDHVELVLFLERDFGIRVESVTEGRAAMRTINVWVDLILAAQEGNVVFE